MKFTFNGITRQSSKNDCCKKSIVFEFHKSETINASRRTGRQLDHVYSFQMTDYVVKQASFSFSLSENIKRKCSRKKQRIRHDNEHLKRIVGAKLVTKLA